MPSKGFRATHCRNGHELVPENIVMRSQTRGKFRRCRTCYNAARRRTRKYDPVEGFNRKLKMYNISHDDFKMLIELQRGNCAICGRLLEDPFIDHDHICCPKVGSCGKCIRGLLCQYCNTGLGFFQDSKENLESAIAYLRLWESARGL